jgi:hypothetical protein
LSAALAAAVAAAAAVASAGPASRGGDGWHSYVSEGGRFQVELPAGPVSEKDEKRFSVLGPIYGKITTVHAGDLVLVIEVRELPALAQVLLPSDFILDRVHESVVEDVDGEEIRASAITLQGLPARDFLYRIPDDPPALERARVVVAEGRLYVVTAREPLPATSTAAVERFLDSFRFR